MTTAMTTVTTVMEVLVLEDLGTATDTGTVTTEVKDITVEINMEATSMAMEKVEFEKLHVFQTVTLTTADTRRARMELTRPTTRESMGATARATPI